MTCAVVVSIKNNQIFIVKENILNDALCATFLMKGLLFQNLSADRDAPPPCFLSLLGRWMSKESIPKSFAIAKAEKTRQNIYENSCTLRHALKVLTRQNLDPHRSIWLSPVRGN